MTVFIPVLTMVILVMAASMWGLLTQLQNCRMVILDQQDEIEDLKRENKESVDKYQMLASHHNEKCTCMEIF
jgi:cell division protein FtsL